MAKAEIYLEGFVSKDPESRAAGNHTITTVTVPVEQGRVKDGQWVADTDQQGNKIVVWWEAEFWNEHGDVVAANIHKGDLVQVRGEARPRVYVKNDGGAGLSAVVVNASVAKVVRKPSRGGAGASGGAGWHNPAPNDSQGFTEPSSDFGGDFAEPF